MLGQHNMSAIGFQDVNQAGKLVAQHFKYLVVGI
jgi:hypothetical protein